MQIELNIAVTSLIRDTQAGASDGLAKYTGELIAAYKNMSRITVRTFAYGKCCGHGVDICMGSFGMRTAASLITPLYLDDWSRVKFSRNSVVHCVDHRILKRRGAPVVATIHDAIALSHPETVRYRFKKAKGYVFRRSAHWATEIITISEHSKREIVKWFGIHEDKITVTPLGVEEKWQEPISEAELARVEAKYALPERFFFFVGTLQPRKNIRRIIDAHKKLPQHLRREVPLIVAGRHGWKCDSEVAEMQNCSDGTMRWIQYVPSEDLLPIFKQATALVWPSLNEGFGLPVLEAFATGLPVVTSNTTSLPEVAGDAALLVNPESVGEIAEAMRTIASDESLQNDLRARGRARAKQFTWDRTARQTIEVYRKAIESF